MNQTNNQHFHDLAFDLLEDGTVKLTQTDCGEDYIITAHPEQIAFPSATQPAVVPVV